VIRAAAFKDADCGGPSQKEGPGGGQKMSDELKPDEWAALRGEINKLRQLITEFEGHLSVLEQRLWRQAE